MHITGISQVVEGDLVYRKECPFGETTVMGPSDDDDGHTNSSEMHTSCQTLVEEMIQSVKVCYRQSIYKRAYIQTVKLVHEHCFLWNFQSCASLVDS